jgi:hypothetical protein
MTAPARMDTNKVLRITKCHRNITLAPEFGGWGIGSNLGLVISYSA